MSRARSRHLRSLGSSLSAATWSRESDLGVRGVHYLDSIEAAAVADPHCAIGAERPAVWTATDFAYRLHSPFPTRLNRPPALNHVHRTKDQDHQAFGTRESHRHDLHLSCIT